jgi:hypothetical protein
MKDYRAANNSNCHVTPTERNTVSIEAFNIEKNAKSQAYHFILSHGLYDRFAEFCENCHSDDPHRDCLEYLVNPYYQLIHLDISNLCLKTRRQFHHFCIFMV